MDTKMTIKDRIIANYVEVLAESAQTDKEILEAVDKIIFAPEVFPNTAEDIKRKTYLAAAIRRTSLYLWEKAFQDDLLADLDEIKAEGYSSRKEALAELSRRREAKMAKRGK